MSTARAAVEVMVPMAEAGGAEGGGDVAILIGLGALAVLVAAVLALMAFGKGRDHS